MRHHSIRLLAVCGALLLGSVAVAWPDAKEPAEQEKSRAARIKRLEEQAADPKADQAAVVQDCHAFRRDHPGTPEAVRAAVLLNKLPSPLDQLDGKQIPEAERKAWLPPEVVAVLGEHRGRHPAAIASAGYSRDGKWLLTRAWRWCFLWDALTLEMRGAWESRDAAFSLDGEKLAVCLTAGDVCVFEFGSGWPKEKSRLKSIGKPWTSVAFESGDSLLLVSVASRQLARWKHTSPGTKPEVVVRLEEDEYLDVELLAGSRLVVVDEVRGQDCRVVCLVSEGKLKPTPIKCRNGQTPYLCADGATLACVGQDGKTVELWELDEAGAKKTSSHTFKKGVHGVRCRQGGSAFVTSEEDGTMSVWPVTVKARKQLGFADDKPCLVIGQQSGCAGGWLAPDGKTLALAYRGSCLRRWDLAKSRFTDEPKGHVGPVLALAVSPDGALLVSAGEDGTVRLWNTSGKEIGQLKGPKGAVQSLSFSKDGKTLIGCTNPDYAVGDRGAENAVYLWEQKRDEGWALKTSWEAHHGDRGRTGAVAYLPSKQTAVTFGLDSHPTDRFETLGSVRFWDLGDARPRDLSAIEPSKKLDKRYDQAVWMGVTKDGSTIGVAVDKKTLHLWDLKQTPPKPLGEIASTKLDWVGRAVFSEDGKRLYVCGDKDPSWDAPFNSRGGIFVWSVGAEPKQVAKPLADEGDYVALSWDDRLLMSCGMLGEVNLWSLEKQAKEHAWNLIGRPSTPVFAPDGRHCFVGNSGGPIYLLRLPSKGKNG